MNLYTKDVAWYSTALNQNSAVQFVENNFNVKNSHTSRGIKYNNDTDIQL